MNKKVYTERTKRLTSFLQKLVICLAVFVVFITSYTMVLPAIAINRQAAADDPAIVTEDETPTDGEQQETETETAYDPFATEEEREEEIGQQTGSETTEAENEKTSVNEKENEEKNDIITFFDDSTDITVYLEAPVEAFPEGTTMAVTPIESEEVLAAVSNTLDAETAIRKVAAVDIAFFDQEGNEIEPACEIKVSLVSDMIKESREAQVVHIDANGEGTLVEQSKEESQNDEVIFESKEFSTYAVVIIETFYIDSEGDTYKVTLTYDENSNIPANATLDVREITDEDEEFYSYCSELKETITEEIRYLRLFDISIIDEDGNKIQPENDVNVRIDLEDYERNDDLDHKAVHFNEDGETDIIDVVLNTEEDVTSVGFDTDAFSVYAIVDTETITAEYLTADGETYLISVTYGPEAEIPEGAVLNVTEIENGTDAYEEYLDLTAENLEVAYSDIGYGRFFDIGIMKDGEEIQPKAPVNVRIELAEGLGSGVKAIHFGEETEKLEVEVTDTENENMGSAIVFETDGFSVYAIVELDSISSLDGKSFGIMNTKDGDSPSGTAMMTGSSDSNTKLTGKTTTVRVNTVDRVSKVYVAQNSNIAMWTFTGTGTDGYFYVSTVTGSGSGATTKYLQISSSGISLVNDPSSEDCKIRIAKNSNGKYKLSTGNGTLKMNGSKFERAAVSANDNDVWMDFAELSNLNDDDFQTYTATKVSVSGTATTSPTADSTLLDDGTYMNYDVRNGDLVILYTRIWNETKYDYYVVDYDGMLIKAYEGGDTISWVGSKRDTMSWIFTEYTSTKIFTSGTFVTTDDNGNLITVTATPESPYTARVPNYYYEFQNDYSRKYIAPKAKGETVIANGTIGVNLNGRRYKEYYSSILAWDAAAYDYGTLAIKKTGNWRLVSRPMAQAIPIYFAKVTVETSEEQLTPVATIDHSSYGITLKIQDYENINYSKNRSQDQLNVLGDTAYEQWTGTKNLLRRNLENDGYPLTNKSVTKTTDTHSLHELYDPNKMITVGQQFLLNTYNETGYFEYDSTQNFAHLIWQDDDPWLDEISPTGKPYQKGDFVIYDQIGTTTDGGATREHGQFFPFNDLEEGYYVSWTNNTDIHANPLSSLDPRKGEKLYAVQYVRGQSISESYYHPTTTHQVLDHFFGMEMSADFMQSASGLDAWGHDLIFEFSGDDDFWLYVDGTLVLDLGGIHSALDGKINFRTGEVTYTYGQNSMRTTNLRELYKLAYQEKYPKAAGMSDEDYADEVNTYLNKIFKDDGSNTGTVFKDYSGHTMKMFYMERGCGASNLHMRFNLAPYVKGAVELEKQVTGSDNIQMTFPFQIWYKDPDNHVLDLAGKDSHPITVTDTKTKETIEMTSVYTVSGMTYHNVFLLEAGQTVSIQFPNEDVEYCIKECLAEKNTFEDPTATPDSVTKQGSINHTHIEIPDSEDPEDYSTTYFDYSTPVTTVRSRKKVVYENHIKDSALKSLNVTKRLWKDEEKTQKITVNENKTQFKYRVYIGKDSKGNYLVYNTGKYYIKDPDGFYCFHYYDEETGESGFRKIDANDSHDGFDYSAGVTDISQLDTTVPDEEPYKSDLQRATFNASPGGAIDEIQAGFTVEIPELLEGTPYMVIERSDEIPTGYNLLGYTYTYDGAAGETVVDDGKGVIHGDLNEEELFVHNQHGFGLRMEKVWSDAEFMLRHDDVYYAIYECQLNSNLDPISYSSAPLTDSVRVLKDPYTSISWFFEDLEDGKSMNNYHVFEVELVVPEGGEITVDPETGVVSGYSQVIRKEEGETIQVGGMSSEQGYSADTTYTVGYNREKVSLSAIAREDTVSNSRPGIKLIKTDMSGDPETGALQGATFTLSNVGYEVKTFVSDASGLIAVAYLQPGKEYVLEEIATPEGYLSVIEDNKVTIRFEVDPVTEVATLYVNGEATDPEDGSYVIKQVTVPPTVTNMPTAIIKNKPYELKAVKIDSYSKLPMAEVHFALYKEVFEVGSNPPVPMPDYVPIEGYEDLVSGPDGVIEGITFADTEERNGLKAGTYYLRETIPSGYNPLGVDIRITISDTGGVTIEGAKRPGSGGGHWTISPIGSNIATLEFIEGDDGNTCLITIKNKPNDPVRIKKMEEGTTKVLQGIKFDLYEMSQIENGQPKPGAQPIVSGVTGADGILLLGGMGGMEDNKSYYLYETETLPGYQLLGAPVIITTARNSSNQLIVKAALNGASLSCRKVKDSSNNDVWEITVYNSTGYELPASGGSGRTVYYITGACLIALSALLERKRH